MASVRLLSPFNNFAVSETATLTWTIPKYPEMSDVDTTSLKFHSPSKSHTFSLRLSTCEVFSLEHIFVELHYRQPENGSLFLYRISILDGKGEKHYTREYMWNYRKSDYRFCQYNATNYIEGEVCDHFLVNDALTIYCEVDILDIKQNQLQSAKQIKSLDKLSENYQTFLEDGKLSDFIVMIGDKEFHVHKAILAAQSAVFATMFEHDEMKEMKEGRVKIEEISVEVFELLIRYIYTGKIESLHGNASDLLIAADWYQLEDLKSICEQSLFSIVTSENVSIFLILSDIHNAQQLKSKCIDYIVDNWKEVKETNCWKEKIKGKRFDLIEQILDSSATN